jgi:hypothetical protein
MKWHVLIRIQFPPHWYNLTDDLEKFLTPALKEVNAIGMLQQMRVVDSFVPTLPFSTVNGWPR